MRTIFAMTRALCRARFLSSSPTEPCSSLERINCFSAGWIACFAVCRQYLSMPFLSRITARKRTELFMDLSRKTVYMAK